MIAHSISILSELKISSFGPYAGGRGAKRYQLNSYSTSWIRAWYTSCWTRQ